MKISERLFHDGQLKEGKRLKLISRLKNDKKAGKCTLIVRIGNDANLLHIISPKEKNRLAERNKALVLVGIAKDMDGAYEVIKEIAEYVVNAHGAITGPLIDKELEIHWES